ncbi:3-oxoacyl-[acyl-carrier-protein] synthase II, chloroplastic [Capsicum annuum]|uniref:beta-ketoacyl-[acyl-carrier-protein] synthase I n=1 Tax=Capsicum annuum TaxID=4072 RepID=A0A2G2ZWY8_CAPAN|nr:3-oxoacyl-[acyl-carrier-protein] synthase II, chloroplastic [Capsicum annuum]
MGGPVESHREKEGTDNEKQIHGCGCATCKGSHGKKKPLMKNRRVVVTGVGVLSPIGHDPYTFYSNLLEDISGISQIEAFDCSEFPSRIAGKPRSFQLMDHVKYNDTFYIISWKSAGYDALWGIRLGLGGFTDCGALSQRNSDPTRASRPWDMDRDGFVIGEGSGVLLLEELEQAKKRKAKIYAEFLGGSFTSDAYHMIEPHPEGSGVVLCMEKALAHSGVKREDVNYINAHAVSTPAGDLTNTRPFCFEL